MRKKKDTLYDEVKDDELDGDTLKNMIKCPKCGCLDIDQCRCKCNSEKFCKACKHIWH